MKCLRRRISYHRVLGREKIKRRNYTLRANHFLEEELRETRNSDKSFDRRMDNLDELERARGNLRVTGDLIAQTADLLDSN